MELGKNQEDLKPLDKYNWSGEFGIGDSRLLLREKNVKNEKLLRQLKQIFLNIIPPVSVCPDSNKDICKHLIFFLNAEIICM